jgi:hypothetical protein
MLLIRDFDRFAQRLDVAESTNPPPTELLEIYKEVEQWAVRDYIASNLKMMKPVSGRQKWLAAGVAFLPANDAKRVVSHDPGAWNLTAGDADKLTNVCRGATAGCMAVCLTNAGQMRMDQAKGAQLRRQLTFTFKRDAFMVLLLIGIAALARTARGKGAKPCVRLNVTSDIDWENIEVTVSPWLSDYLKTMGTNCPPGKYRNVPDALPAIQFYDYTKIPERIQAFASGKWPRNYWLTWSLAETPQNRKVALWVLANKVSTVAVPFDVKSRKQGSKTVDGKKVGGKILPLPTEMAFIENGPGIEPVRHVFPVIDADHDDMRFLDKPGSFSGLRFKVPGIGKGQRRGAIAGGMSTKEKIDAASGFVVPVPPAGIPEIAVYRRWQGANTNPPRDPVYSGKFSDVPGKIGRIDGDTAVVPSADGKAWEVWIWTPFIGRNGYTEDWSFVRKVPNPIEAIALARKMVEYDNPRFVFKSGRRVKKHARVASRQAKLRATVDRKWVAPRSNPSADEKLSWIKSQLESGRDVYLTTATRSTKYTPKHLASFADLLRVKGGSLQMRERKSWVCADYVRITAR